MLGMIIDTISTFMYSKLLVILLIGAGIYFYDPDKTATDKII